MGRCDFGIGRGIRRWFKVGEGGFEGEGRVSSARILVHMTSGAHNQNQISDTSSRLFQQPIRIVEGLGAKTFQPIKA